MHTKKAFLAFLLAAALLILMVCTASAVSQTWYLSISEDPNNSYEEIMFKGSPSSVVGWVIIQKDTDSNVWIANESAECNVDLSGDWTGTLIRTSVGGDKSVTLKIGAYNPSSGGFSSAKSTTGTFKGKTCNFTIVVTPPFTVHKGEYLAFMVENRDKDRVLIIETEEGASWISSPPADPGYPVPELPTIVLMSTGLLALTGFVVYSRRKRIEKG